MFSNTNFAFIFSFLCAHYKIFDPNTIRRHRFDSVTIKKEETKFAKFANKTKFYNGYDIF